MPPLADTMFRTLSQMSVTSAAGKVTPPCASVVAALPASGSFAKRAVASDAACGDRVACSGDNREARPGDAGEPGTREEDPVGVRAPDLCAAAPLRACCWASSMSLRIDECSASASVSCCCAFVRLPLASS